MRIHLILFFALVFMGRLAHADDAADARAHYRKATAQFAIGRFEQAAEEYETAFLLKQDAAFLFNAAQAYRLGGNHKKAIILYKNYLNLYPRAKNGEEVRAQIARLEQAVAADHEAKTSPPTEPAEPSRSVDSTPASAAAPSAARPSAAAPNEGLRPTEARAPESSAQPLYKKWWLWTAVGVVVAAGVTTAVVLGTRSPGSWNNYPDVVNQSLVGARF